MCILFWFHGVEREPGSRSVCFWSMFLVRTGSFTWQRPADSVQENEAKKVGSAGINGKRASNPCNWVGGKKRGGQLESR